MANQNPPAQPSSTAGPAAGGANQDSPTEVLSRFAPEQIKVQPIDPEQAAEQAAVKAREAEAALGEPAAPHSASPTANPSHASATLDTASQGAAVPAGAATSQASKVSTAGSGVASPAGSSADPAGVEKAKTSPPPRTMAQIEADMDETRERLAATVGQIQEALQPKNLMKRQVAKVKEFYVDEYGAVRPERVAGTVGVVVGSIVVIKVVKRVF